MRDAARRHRPDGFLNVDLEVGARTRARILPLVTSLDHTLFELYRGRIGSHYRAHYEVRGCTRDATSTILELAAAIEVLAPRARRAWNAATVRDFNIGVELERSVKSIELAIDDTALRRVVALGGRIVFTAYQVAAMRETKPRRDR